MCFGKSTKFQWHHLISQVNIWCNFCLSAKVPVKNNKWSPQRFLKNSPNEWCTVNEPVLTTKTFKETKLLFILVMLVTSFLWMGDAEKTVKIVIFFSFWTVGEQLFTITDELWLSPWNCSYYNSWYFLQVSFALIL